MPDPLLQTWRMLAKYNRLANEQLYNACARLTDDERKLGRPAFFGSIHGTLNHILLADRLWLARFAGEEVDTPPLNTILYDGFSDLRRAREAEDTRIEAFARSMDEAFLRRTIRYRNHQGRLYVDPVPLLVTHFFNHQTHHRGQVHDLLAQTRVTPPSLDLHRMFRP